MKIKLDDVEYDIELKLPIKLENELSVSFFLNQWNDLYRDQEITKKRELRLKKINEINAKFK